MRSTVLTKSSGVSLKYANVGKREALMSYIKDYQNIVSQVIAALQGMEERQQKFCPVDVDQAIVTPLNARCRQCASKQAIGILNSVKGKARAIRQRAEWHQENGRPKKARELFKKATVLDKSKIDVSTVNPELDSRFVRAHTDNGTTFDGWIEIKTGKENIIIPFKRHRHLEKMEEFGAQTKGIRLERNRIVFIYRSEKPETVQEGSVLGIDVGQTSAISCSDGTVISEDKDGHTYKSICEKIARKKKGSKAFKRAAQHRKNYCGWAVNRMNLKGVKRINRENILHMKRGKRTSRSLTAWSYRELFDKVDSRAEVLGVLIQKQNPTYTSQRCSKCGWVHKGNRKRKQFYCLKCNHTQDADSNASLNLSFELPALSRQQCRKGANRTGFYWRTYDQERIVPDAQKLTE